MGELEKETHMAMIRSHQEDSFYFVKSGVFNNACITKGAVALTNQIS
jgi:hypothetical protein